MNTPETTPFPEEPPIDKDLKITQLKWLLDIRDGEIIHLHSQLSKALTDKEAAMLAAGEARYLASNLISRETVELLRADKARDEAFESASDKDDEIALLKSNLAKAVAENDAARNERDRVWAAAVSIGSANAKLLTENSALKASNAELMSGVDKALESEELAASRGKEHLEWGEGVKRERDVLQQLLLDLRKQSGWRQFKDQKPTMDDSDARGCIMMCGADGLLGVIRVRDADQFDTAWWRPTMSPVTLTPLGQWMQVLTPDERSRFNCNGNLRAIWESIEKFNQKK